MYSAISTVRCSRACWLAVNSTSGSFSSRATLSETFTAKISRPWYDVPRLTRRAMLGFAATTAFTAADISA